MMLRTPGLARLQWIVFIVNDKVTDIEHQERSHQHCLQHLQRQITQRLQQQHPLNFSYCSVGTLLVIAPYSQYTGRSLPCIWPVYSPCTQPPCTGRDSRLYGRVMDGPCTRYTAVYTAVFGSWKDHVHGPCTAVAVYTVHGRKGRKHGRGL